jgi:hypothetical protein
VPMVCEGLTSEVYASIDLVCLARISCRSLLHEALNLERLGIAGKVCEALKLVCLGCCRIP